MFADPVVTLVFLMGILITIVSIFGFYQFRSEEKESFEEARKKKLAYRTNEEFIETDMSKDTNI